MVFAESRNNEFLASWIHYDGQTGGTANSSTDFGPNIGPIGDT